MITFLLGVAALAGGGYWLYMLTNKMTQDQKIRFGAAALLIAIGAAFVG